MKNLRLLAYCFFLIGCFAPLKVKEKKSIFVSIFKNNTREYWISNELNLAMIDEIMKDGNFIMENSKDATFLLEGCIISYKETPIAWDREMKIRESRIEITIEYELFDKGSLIKNGRLSSGIIYLYKDNPEEERGRLLKSISRALINDIRRIIK